MTPRSKRLWGPVVAIAVLSVTIALVASALLRYNESARERIGRLEDSGELDDAERLAWQQLSAHGDDVALWIRFIDIHAELHQELEDSGEASPVSDAAIRQRLARMPRGAAATLAGFWYEHIATEVKPGPAVLALADGAKPARYANYLVGRIALDDEEDGWREGARRFEREGLFFPENRTRFLRRALGAWIDHDAWDDVRRRVHDPRYRGAVSAGMRLELAVHDRDWPGVLLWLWPAGYGSITVWPIALAVLSAVLWLVITTRLGRAGDGVRGRMVLYALAFALGILSIYPTLLVSVVEETVFHFDVVNQPLPDAIYYVAGVGLREELSKLLLFLPLLPALLRRGSRIEAMTCGALVGLGFAAEENIGYFSHFAAGVAISRFLTANFLHMSLTAMLALSVFDAARGRSTPRDRFNVVFPLVVCVHGAYDFFLADPDFSRFSLVSMMLLLFMARQFLRQLLIATSRFEEEGVLRLFVASLTLLTGVSYIYATTLVGPWVAFRLVAVGTLGVAFVIYIFVRELT